MAAITKSYKRTYKKDINPGDYNTLKAGDICLWGIGTMNPENPILLLEEIIHEIRKDAGDRKSENSCSYRLRMAKLFTNAILWDRLKVL